MKLKNNKMFIYILILFGSSYFFLKLIFPFMARLIVGSNVNLPVPDTLFLWYMTLIVISLLVYVSSSEQDFKAFLQPIMDAIRGKEGISQTAYKTVFVLMPLWIGYHIYDSFVPKMVLPAVTRQQHPGMSHSSAVTYSGMENPFRNPTPEMLEKFKTDYQQLDDQQGIGDAFPKKTDISNLDSTALKQLYFSHIVNQGRELYQKNCRPCHGTGFDGVGPMARIFKLKPVAFTDPGTIATLVEDAVFWRVSEGGIGLPAVSTPWDSPMPKWKDELSEEDRWKIIMAIYDDIAMKPRVLEMKVE